MLDFDKLKTPSEHGDTLVVPEPKVLPRAVAEGDRLLRGNERRLLDSTLGEWRRRTRELIAGTDTDPIIVTGHQPAFIHAGVWAKHVVAMRLAQATGGVAINLVVDNDAPRQTVVQIPRVAGNVVTAEPVRFAELPAGQAFEQIPRQGPEAVAAFERNVREATGYRYEQSQFPVFLDAFAEAGVTARDWVDQAVAGRRAVEARFGITLEDRRVSDVWWTPLLRDMLLAAPRFHGTYNNALARYRQAHGVRGVRRPIPDLIRLGDAFEVPVWVYRTGEARRRLFVERRGDAVRLLVGTEEISRWRADEPSSREQVGWMPPGAEGWRFRPRALTLMIWARLLLADLFIHGIGGVKYDLITDRILADYYGVMPPPMACVSATWLLDLPRSDATEDSVGHARRILRDLRCNPQRHLRAEGELTDLLERREAAVRRSSDLRRDHRLDRDARREAFDEIRAANAVLLGARPEVTQAYEAELARVEAGLASNKVDRGREYFFGLHSDEALEALCGALPDVGDFGV